MTLFLYLEGPLQSWGDKSLFYTKETLPFPTLSGLAGMAACALGKAEPEKEWIDKFVSLEINIYGTKRENVKDVPPILSDFHMVGSGYNSESAFEDQMIPRKTDGKKAVGGGAKMTYRNFLQDAAFIVFLSSVDEVFLNELANAFMSPSWPIFLGKKVCAPSDLVFQGLFQEKEEAIQKALLLLERKNRSVEFEVISGNVPEKGQVFHIDDVPLSLGLNKKYSSRSATLFKKSSL